MQKNTTAVVGDTHSYIHTYSEGDPLVHVHSSLYSRKNIRFSRIECVDQPVMPVAVIQFPVGTSLVIKALITTKLHEIKAASDSSRGELRCK